MAGVDAPVTAQAAVLALLRAVDTNALGLTPVERRVLRGCAPRLAAELVRFGIQVQVTVPSTGRTDG